MTDLDKIKQMEELNWKPASQYWCEQYHMKRKKLVEAADEIERLRDALQFYADLSKYPAPFTGGLGELYFDCGTIARAALEESK